MAELPPVLEIVHTVWLGNTDRGRQHRGMIGVQTMCNSGGGALACPVLAPVLEPSRAQTGR